MKKPRSFLFTTSSTGWHRVLCRNCGWKRRQRRRDPRVVFTLAETHDCEGVEAAAEMEMEARS